MGASQASAVEHDRLPSGSGTQGSSQPHLVWVHMADPKVDLEITTLFETTRELCQMGWRVTPILQGDPGRQIIRGLEVVCIQRPKVYLLGNLWFHFGFFAYVVRHWKTVDIVLAHQVSMPWLVLLRWLRDLRADRQPLIVMDTRDLNLVAEDLRTRLRSAYYRWGQRLANRWADGQTTITLRMAELTGVREDRLWGTWPSGVHAEPFAEAQASRRWPSSTEPIKLVYIGILLRERNLAPLCQAVEMANAAGMAFELTIVGNGPEKAYVDELLEYGARQGSGVQILPPVPHDQVPALLGRAHVGVAALPLPTAVKYQASSPIKLFEYLAAGLPVLVSRNPCYTDVVGSGQYAFWVEGVTEGELAAALQAIWAVRDRLEVLGREAGDAAAGWTWRRTAEKLKVALLRGLAVHG